MTDSPRDRRLEAGRARRRWVGLDGRDGLWLGRLKLAYLVPLEVLLWIPAHLLEGGLVEAFGSSLRSEISAIRSAWRGYRPDLGREVDWRWLP